MINFLKLIRYKNLLMVLLTLILTKYALIHQFLEQPFLSNFLFILFSISILCVTASGYIINDILDVKSDLINKPNKVVIDKRISKKHGLIVYYLLVLISLIIAFYISYTKGKLLLFSIFPITILLLLLYSKYLKKLAFIGNIIIAVVSTSIILLLYYFDFQEQEKASGLLSAFKVAINEVSLFVALVYYSIFSFLTMLIREILKDIEDLDGDYASNMKTLPIILGKERTKYIAFIISLITILFEILVIKDFFVFGETIYLACYLFVFSVIPMSIFAYKLWNAVTKKEFTFLSNLLKIIMLFGILSMFLIKYQ